VPVANQRKAEIKNQHIDRLPQNLPARPSNIYLQDHFETSVTPAPANKRSRRVFIGLYNAEAQSAEKVSIQDYEGVFIVHRIDANTMLWRDSTWLAVRGYERTFANGGEVATRFDTLRLRDLFFTPEVLTRVRKPPEEMSYVELQEYIRELTNNGGNPERWLVDLYLKLSFPFANFIIVLFGAPLAAGKVRSGGAVGVALSLIVCFLYFGTVKTAQSMGQNGTLEPLLAAWLGNLIFLCAGAVILVKARK
jgi:lipopolysaccharide export system permease protein